MRIKIRKTDQLFSRLVRERAGWVCERCKRKPEAKNGLHCSHFWGRGRENTRFDFENCDALCYGCHAYFHSYPQEYHEWKLAKLGIKRFKELQIRANTYGKRDDKQVLMYLQEMEKQDV